MDDFEPEELFDSILNEETSGAGGGAERGEGAAEPETARPPKPAGAAPTGPKLHEPEQRSYPAEEETLVGGRGPASTDATELLPLMGSSWDDDLPGSSDAVDQLLHSTAPSETPPAKPIAPPPPRAAKPPVPRPAGSRAPVTVPRPASLPSRTRPAPTGTALPPPVNPAGPPPRQPFPLAGTPAPGGTRYDEDDETIRYTDRPSAPDPATTPPQDEADAEPTAFLERLDSDIAELLPPPEEAAERAPPDDAPRPADYIPEFDAPTGFVARPSLLEPERLAMDPPESASVPSASMPSARASEPPQRLAELLEPGAELPPADPGAPPAAARLSEAGVLNDWIARAEWMESEARTSTDPQAKARALLVASELWALSGHLQRARDVARVAAAVAPGMPLAQRQARWLAAADEDWKPVAQALESEIRASATPAARAHASFLSAEIHRRKLDDPEGAKKKAAQLLRNAPEDARGHLLQLLEALGSGQPPERFRAPEAPELTWLAQALEQIVALRGGLSARAPASDRALDLVKARAAAGERQRGDCAQALLDLARVPELERAALWLAAALDAPSGDTRDRAIEALRRLVVLEPGPAVRRALAARALEQNDRGALDAALARVPVRQDADDDFDDLISEPSVDAFSAADRLAIAALGGADADAIEPLVQTLAPDRRVRPLAIAAAAALNSRLSLDLLPGDEEAQARARLGRALVEPQADLEAAVQQFASRLPDHPLSAVLELELGLRNRDAARVTRAFGDGEDVLQHLAAALVFEVAGDAGAAEEHYRMALAIDPTCEAAARATLANADPNRAAELLSKVAEHVSPEQASLLLIEAALRVGPDDWEALHGWLERAAELDPDLLLAQRLGEHFARERADAGKLLEWLRARRENALAPYERALDLVRESLLLVEEDPTLSSSLLENALQIRPVDVGVRELRDRMSGAPPAERAAGYERLASLLPAPQHKRLLLLDAAFGYQTADDGASALRAARAAGALSDDDLPSVLAERLAIETGQAATVTEELFRRARQEEDPVRQRELYERLTAIDGGRADQPSTILFQSAILERTPRHLPALRRLEHAHIGANHASDLGPIAARLASQLSGAEATGHAFFAAYQRKQDDPAAATGDLLEIALRASPPPLWALRETFWRALIGKDQDAVLRTSKALIERATRPLDQASLALRGAEAALGLGRLDDARELLDAALAAVPEHPIALARMAALDERGGRYEAAAEALEASAAQHVAPEHRRQLFARAGILWLDRVGNTERAKAALERAVEIDVHDVESFERLQALYVAERDGQKLAELLARRLAETTDPDERIALEIRRGRALAELGDRPAAKAALASALDANPEHADALATFADLCLAEQDLTAAEDALIRLARHVADPEAQADVYSKLGALYDDALPNPERAELAYREVLKRRPGDPIASEKLVLVYARLGDAQKAVRLQNELIEAASNSDQKRDRLLALARVYALLGQPRDADAVLEKTRRAFAQDARVLQASVEHYNQSGEERTAQVLLDRAANEARRALSTGRFDASFFRSLAAVAELRQDEDARRVTEASLHALLGEPDELGGAGLKAAAEELDDLLAPDLLSLPLRAVLRQVGDALDRAYPIDLRALKASVVETSDVREYVQQLASAFGLFNLELLVADALGFACLPASSAPPVLVVGRALLDSDDARARDFLLLKALKIMATRGSGLLRVAPVDVWPVLAAVLSRLVPHWQPGAIDDKRFADAVARIHGALPPPADPDLSLLAQEIIGSIGSRGSQVGLGLQQMGGRAALLAVGSPGVGLSALGQSGGAVLPASGPERMRWIGRHPEARDLLVFSVSEAYSQARRRAGVGQAP